MIWLFCRWSDTFVPPKPITFTFLMVRQVVPAAFHSIPYPVARFLSIFIDVAVSLNLLIFFINMSVFGCFSIGEVFESRLCVARNWNGDQTAHPWRPLRLRCPSGAGMHALSLCGSQRISEHLRGVGLFHLIQTHSTFLASPTLLPCNVLFRNKIWRGGVLDAHCFRRPLLLKQQIWRRRPLSKGEGRGVVRSLSVDLHEVMEGYEDSIRGSASGFLNLTFSANHIPPPSPRQAGFPALTRHSSAPTLGGSGRCGRIFF